MKLLLRLQYQIYFKCTSEQIKYLYFESVMKLIFALRKEKCYIIRKNYILVYNLNYYLNVKTVKTENNEEFYILLLIITK